jgi:formylglycine-generating enzyme required for sulfatase activity
MKSIIHLTIFILILMFVNGCLFLNQQQESIQTENSIKIEETFIPITIQDGLIEMEKKDRGDFITPEMVLIEAGKFKFSEKGLVRTIQHNFFIGKYEVTFEEYSKFAKATKRVMPRSDGIDSDLNPVVNVSYEDAKAYAEWLSKKTGDKYRLPTETEWEYAARAGTETRFFFGDSIKDIDRYAWYWKNSEDGAKNIGQKLPNQWNLFDMAGNVWEWCEDWFVEDVSAIPNGGKPYSVSTKQKVVKGGSWNDYPLSLRHSNRLGFDPNIKMNDTGFRLVMEY